MAFRLWSSLPNNGCLPMEGPRIRNFFRDWVSQVVFSIQQNPEEVDSNASEGMNLPMRADQAKSKNFLLPCPLHRLPALPGLD